MDKSEILKLIPNELKVFFQGILDEADIFIADEEDLNDLLISMYGHFNNFILSAILEHLPAEKVETFVDLSEQEGSTTQVQDYIEKNLPNSKEVITKAYEDFRNLYLDTIAIEDARMEAMDEEEKNNSTLNTLKDLAKGTSPTDSK